MRFRPWFLVPALAALVLAPPLAAHAAPATSATTSARTPAAKSMAKPAATTATPAVTSKPGAPSPSGPSHPKPLPPAPTTTPGTHPTGPVHHPSLLDLNAATAPELEKLPGIGQAIAAKIVAGRPFKSKSELLSRGLVNQDQYSKLSPYVIAKQATAAATQK